MKNKLAKSALIIDIIGVVFVLSPLIMHIEDLFDYENIMFFYKLFSAMYIVGNLLLLIGFIMGLVSLKNKPRLLSYISIAIPPIVGTVLYFLVQSALEGIF